MGAYNPENLDLLALKLFIRAAELKNISAAGRELGLAGPAASNRLSRLEQQLSLALLHRTTRAVNLSEDGKAFFVSAKKILEVIDAEMSVLLDDDELLSGPLRVGAPGSFGRMVLLPAISAFEKLYPNIDLDFVFSDQILDPTEAGVDVTIRIANLSDSALKAKKISAEKRLVCASPEYLDRFGTPKSVEDLLSHKCIVLGEERKWTFSDGDSDYIHRCDRHFRINCGEGARILAEQGHGLINVACWNAREAIENSRLKVVDLDMPLRQDRAIWAVFHQRDETPPKTRAFLTFLGKLSI